MTDIWTETLNDWDRQAEGRAAEEAHKNEKERQGVAKLLAVRGKNAAAAIVAMSDWRTDDVGDNWRGEEYQAVLAVPPEGFDAVTPELRDAIAAAAGDVIGPEFAELIVRVRLEEAEPGWDGRLVAQLRERESRGAGADAAVDVLALPAGPTDAG